MSVFLEEDNSNITFVASEVVDQNPKSSVENLKVSEKSIVCMW